MPDSNHSAPTSNSTQARPSLERIAIIGVGCRFPGGINDSEAMWKLLVEGRDAVCEVPPDRWNVERYYDPEPAIMGKSVAKRGGFVHGIEEFDPQFFGISPREAPYIDPQQRLLLETAWEAIEDGGMVLDFEKGTDLAVFVGISHTDYQMIQSTPWEQGGITPHTPTGTAHSIAANRISYCLNLKGPSVAMDTACSSALTAVHAACEHIWAGRGDTALAGGVTVMITPGGFIGFSQATMLSPDGRCAAFDASANGFVRGEGAGMVLLKRLSKALEDGDPIQGVIVSTAINQDGHTNGISLPSPEAQARLVKDACAYAGVDPKRIAYVEAHGTGTAVGDPIEATALSDALCAGRTTEEALPIGSVKTNLGHLETAAGVAGLMKAMLVLERGKIPGSLHFTSPNPHIDLDALKLRIPVELEPLPEADGPRLAGVNSFGFGGANAHVILEEPPARPHVAHGDPYPERSWPVVLSARSEEALKGNAARLSAWLGERINANGSSPVLPDLVYNLGTRRNHHPFRLTLVARTMEEAIQELNDFATGNAGPKVRSTFSPRPEQAPRVAFVMSGQGPQWWGMGRELMEHEPVFRDVIERCDAAMRPFASWSLLEELSKTEESSRMDRTEVAQPAIFAMQVALAELWKAWGIQPAAIVGHSVGEIAAACVAGIFSIEEGARIIVLRAKFMDSCARGAGTMLAVGMSESEATALIARSTPGITIAAFNGPKSLTLAGPRVALEAMATELEAQGVFARLVRVDHPFHHPLMQPASEQLEAALEGLQPHPETVPFFSTVTGSRCAGKDCTPAHWGKGIRQPVLFAPAVDALADFGVDVWLELSAHPALARSIQECIAPRGAKATVVSSARREQEHESILEAAMDLHRASVPIAFQAMTPSRRLLSLPSYAWDKSRWWHESSDWREGRLAPGGRGLLDYRQQRAMPTWTGRLDSRHMAFLKDHKVESHVVFPGAAFVDMAIEAGVQLFEGRPFVVEDFEIRKPLILPDPASSVLLELAYNPSDRTFAIQSKFDQGGSWSVHVVGSMRGERTDSAFSASQWESSAPQTVLPVNVESFYGYMSDMGLRYGEEFRAVRELAAAGGESKGLVTLSADAARRASAYPLHPVLLDAALHVFSAGAQTVESRRAGLKLPVRFGRILFLRSPGASARVATRVLECNDEYLEGRLALYDESGEPCVLVDGFRAIAVAGTRKSGAPGGIRDVVYHVAWERTPSQLQSQKLEPAPLSALRDAAQTALDNVLGVRGRATLEQALAEADELTAALLARGLKGLIADKGTLSAESLKVSDTMRQPFARMMQNLQQRGLITESSNGFRPNASFDEAAEAAEGMLRDYIARHAGHLPEALLVAANCAELGPILRGEKEAVQVLFSGTGAELMEQFYGDGLYTAHWLAAIAAAVQEGARRLPEGRGLKILEVGAGTGGLTSYVLPQLERGLHHYVFSDVSASFFSAAGQKLGAYPEVEYKVFNLEKPGTEQGLDAGTFDFIIGTNVLHAVSDVRATLRHLHELLKPGGSLVFMDVATPQLWTESVFGLTSGWWSLKDRDLRPEQPLMQRATWEKVLREEGFTETTSLPGLMGPRGEGQVGLLARKDGSPEGARDTAESLELLSEFSWLVFAEEGGVGEELATRVRNAGGRCRVVHRGSAFATTGEDQFTIRPEASEDWKQLLQDSLESNPPQRLVYLWPLDEGSPTEAGPALGTDALLHLTHALELTHGTSKLRFDLVTRGAQPVGREGTPTAVAQAPAIGMLRVILNEHPNFLCRAVDLAAEVAPTDGELLWKELLSDATDREVAFRGDARYVQRLDRGRPVDDRVLPEHLPLRLESRERGHLDTLRFVPFSELQCAPGEVLIEVKAAGMNFRDVLKALALYPGEAPDARIFGDEVAGVVRAVGANISHVRPGDRVFGLAVFGLSTLTLARGGDIRPIPSSLTFEQAATIPVVFMTSWHALQNVARMRAGESILVHAGAGGVGMAAIQIALHLGATVIASAGSAAKRALLKTMGVHHVIDSRRGDFVEAVMEITKRKGVDVVLNALAGEAIPMGLACLAEFGRFIEIGKRDIYQNSRIPLWPLRKNASFHVVAMDAVFSGDEELTRKMLGEIAGLVEEGAFTSLPYRAFPASRVDSAFRLMAAGKHIGKVIVSFAEAFVPRRGEALASPFTPSADGTYLITGAFGGFGKVISEWLVAGGARHLTLASRSGAASTEAKAFVDSLQKRGVGVNVLRADVGLDADVAGLFAAIAKAGVPLRGVFHLAMVIDDAPMSVLTAERFRSVVQPKAYGAWLLHEHTRAMSLDCFVMFSSVSSIFGNPAQANYGAANAFLDSLAHHRRALGLPALTINWGVLGGEGYVARNEKVAEFLAKQGTAELTPGEVTKLLDTFLGGSAPQMMAIRVEWAKWRQFFRGMQENPFLERIFATIEGQESSGTTSDWRGRIEAAKPEEKEAVIGQALREVIGSVLRVKPDSLRDDQPLTDLGLDSLMGVEIENSIEASIGVALPPASLLRARTIGHIAKLIAEHLGAKAAPSAPVPVMAARPATADEVNIDALSDDDLDALLGDAGSGEPTEKAVS